MSEIRDNALRPLAADTGAVCDYLLVPYFMLHFVLREDKNHACKNPEPGS